MPEDELDVVAQLNAGLLDAADEIRALSEEAIASRDPDALIDMLSGAVDLLNELAQIFAEVVAQRATESNPSNPQRSPGGSNV
jgi:hypothetical protein